MIYPQADTWLGWTMIFKRQLGEIIATATKEGKESIYLRNTKKLQYNHFNAEVIVLINKAEGLE